MQNTNLFGIIGNPLGHSLSPALHNWAFTKLHYKGIFQSWPLQDSQLKDFITAMQLLRICGVCVTIPHKQNVIPLLDAVSSRAKSIGAVNTLYWQGDKLCGENTDVDGFKLPLMQKPVAKVALVLGAGGAARAVLVGLKELGVKEIYVTNRDASKAKGLAHDFDVTSLEWEERENLATQWIINTTPLGMRGAHEGQSPYAFKAKMRHILAYDLVYNPLKTQFLYDAQAFGYETQDGLDMFVGQALSQMKIWMGKCVESTQARKFLIKKLNF